MYEIDLINIAPATDAQIFHMRFSQSGSFLDTLGDYHWGVYAGGNDQSSTGSGDTSMQLTGDLPIGNVAGELITLTIMIFRPSASGVTKSANWDGGGCNSTPNRFATTGFGQLRVNQNAIDGVRFLFNSGNIGSGYYAQRAYSFT
jgi:hypothetical protein